MVRKLPALSDIRVFGTDGETALYTALRTVWKNAGHLLCWIHSKDNVIKKLGALNMSYDVQQEYLKDIYGEKVGETKVKGLADSENEDEFEVKFNQLGK